jgi:hypothetical protein
MPKRAQLVKAIFRGIERVQGTFQVEFGPIRASGVPAILIGVSGIIVASGVAAVLAKNAERLPETLREARGLAETLRGDRPRLNP